jgi:MarR family transcriptional regulator, temperature-dependent positive regulator of motility
MPESQKSDQTKGSNKPKKVKSKLAKILSDTAQVSELDQSPLHLLHRVLSNALEIYTSKQPSGMALSQRQYAVLSVLMEAKSRDKSGLTQSEMVRLTGIDRSTMADLLARMIKQGHLLRQKSTEDSRANLVSLTPEGIGACATLKPIIKATDMALLRMLPDTKRQGFLKALRRISQYTAANDEVETTVSEVKQLKKAQKEAKKLKSLPMPTKAD